MNNWTKTIAGSRMKYVWNDVYLTGLMVVLNATNESAAKITSRYYPSWNNIPSFAGKDGETWWYEKDGTCFIFLTEMADRTKLYSVFCHELIHWEGFLMKARGMRWDVENDEPQAILMQWAVRNFHKFIQTSTK